MKFFSRAFALPTKSHAHLYPFDRPIKSLYFRSFVVSVLFARFHFKVIGKSFYISPHVRGCDFQNPRNFASGIRNSEIFACGIWNPGLWNPEYRLKQCGIPLTIGFQNPSSTDKNYGTQYLESRLRMVWNGMVWNPHCESKTVLDKGQNEMIFFFF